MALRIIGAGFGRTGTHSLKIALQRLGFSKCHHMKEVAASRHQVEAWHALSRGGQTDWDRLFEGFEASCDWPSSAYWEQLYHHFPDSVVILTARDDERWYESVSETIYAVSRGIPNWLTWMSPRIRMLKEMIRDTVWDGVFGGRFEDKVTAIGIYRENSERVRRVVAPDRLLVFEAKEGWEPLCRFLNVPVPASPYPHVNDAASVKRILVVMKVLRWLPLILLGALVALLAL